MNLPRILVASLVGPTLFLTACGGGGGGSQPNNASGLEEAAEDLWNAIFSGNTDDAYAYLTEDCKDDVSEREFREAMSILPGLLEGFFGVDPDKVKVDDVETRNVDDGKGQAKVSLDAGNDDLNDLVNEGNQFQDWVYEGGSWRIADCDDFDDGGGNFDPDNDGGDLDDEPGDGSETSRSAPAPVGTPVEVSGWMITVNSADLDATEAILEEDEFIDPPEDGDVFVLINITATYSGDGENDSSSLFSAVTWGAVGKSAVAYDEFNDTCTFFGLPDELDSSVEVFEGGTIEGNICFSVTEDDADSLLIYADESFGFSSDGREWFSLR